MAQVNRRERRGFRDCFHKNSPGTCARNKNWPGGGGGGGDTADYAANVCDAARTLLVAIARALIL
jgi:hypothetical protein